MIFAPDKVRNSGKIVFATFIFCGISFVKGVIGQSLTVSLALLDRKWTATGSFRASIDKSQKLTLSGVAQYDETYKEREGKSLIIGSLGYSIIPAINVLAGTFYSSELKLNPAISAQYIWSKGKFRGLIYPIWIIHDPNVMLTFFRMEYYNSLNARLEYFLRFQPYIVSGFWKHYYTRAGSRAGIRIKSWEMGFATDTDFVGKKLDSTSSFGIFFQKRFNL